MALGVSRQYAHLAAEVFHVVHHEGKTAMKLLEAATFCQGFGSTRLGEMARRLPPRDLEEIEIFPVQRASDQRAGEQHESFEFTLMIERHRNPIFVVADDPFWHR